MHQDHQRTSNILLLLYRLPKMPTALDFCRLPIASSLCNFRFGSRVKLTKTFLVLHSFGCDIDIYEALLKANKYDYFIESLIDNMTGGI